MLKNYIKIAWRNLKKHRTDSLINITGLCIAFTSAMLLLLNVRYEFSFDNFHLKADKIYRLYFQTQGLKGVESQTTMPAPLEPSLIASFPSIRYGTRHMNSSVFLRYKNQKIAQNLTFADPDFFRMFSFPIIMGTHQGPLQQLNQVVLRRGSAKALFGKEDPIGKMIDLKYGDSWKPFIVSAVTEDLPDNSSITYDAVIRFENVRFYFEVSTLWGARFHEVYVELSPGTSPANLQASLPGFINRFLKENIERLKRDGVHPAKDGSFITLSLQRLSDVHTNENLGGSKVINKTYLYLLFAIGLLILAIACINFINLSIGRSFTRTKEIGLRKTMGASRPQITRQFWGEAFLLCTIAFVISCAAAYGMLPQYRTIFGVHADVKMLESPGLWIIILGCFFCITMAAGGYPALVMSRLPVVDVLKGKTTGKRSAPLRSTLIALQFIITVGLIACTLIAAEQVRFLRTRPLGYNISQVISVPASGELDPTIALGRMRTLLKASPDIVSVTGLYDNLGDGGDGSSRRSAMGFDYKNRTIESDWMGVSYDFVKTLDIQMIAGRDFSDRYRTDSTSVLINEAMAQEIGEKNLIGLRLPVDSAKPLTIIGVVQNFNYKSLREKIKPLTLVLDKNFAINYILIKVESNNLPTTMDRVKAAWKVASPGSDFKASFLDENINRQYKKEEKLVTLFMAGSGMAISLSCMGLLAMVILMISQRTKEIGIRKLLGASVTAITILLSAEIFWLLLISTVVATPLAWFAMHQWLDRFAYRMAIGWWIFLEAGALASAIALVTVGFHSMTAAAANPAKSLKTD